MKRAYMKTTNRATRQRAPDFCVMQIARVTTNFPTGINGNTCGAISDTRRSRVLEHVIFN